MVCKKNIFIYIYYYVRDVPCTVSIKQVKDSFCSEMLCKKTCKCNFILGLWTCENFYCTCAMSLPIPKTIVDSSHVVHAGQALNDLVACLADISRKEQNAELMPFNCIASPYRVPHLRMSHCPIPAFDSTRIWTHAINPVSSHACIVIPLNPTQSDCTCQKKLNVFLSSSFFDRQGLNR